MKQSIRVLLVEDCVEDAELLVRELSQSGFEPTSRRVETEEEFLSGLGENVDLILSDHQLPHFSGLRALALLKAKPLEIPFILVSGTIGEEFAVKAMQLGAADYLLKDRLVRLGPAVHRAMEQSRLRKEHGQMVDALREREERLQLASEVSGVGTFELDHIRGRVYGSSILATLFGLPAGQNYSHFHSNPSLRKTARISDRKSKPLTNQPGLDDSIINAGYGFQTASSVGSGLFLRRGFNPPEILRAVWVRCRISPCTKKEKRRNKSITVWLLSW